MEDIEDGDNLRMRSAALDPRALEVAAHYFALLEPPDEDDRACIAFACGREPRGEVLVAARCPRGRPAVILTLPFEPPDGRAAPPLLWLTCPSAANAAARLEAVGGVREAGARLERDQASAEPFAAEEERFALMLNELARASGGARLAERLRERGAAGGRRGAVKCLHAHLAHRLAAGRGVVGEWCLEELGGPEGVWCESIPQACLH